MTPRADVTVRLATPRDVAGIVDLESRYFVDNLDAAARAKGFISVLHSAHWFASADGRYAGRFASTRPSGAAASTARSTQPPGSSIATAMTSEWSSLRRTIPDRCTPRPPNSGPDRWRNSRSIPRSITCWHSTSAIVI